jgi:uncharacterized protein (DUF39 family)
MKTVKSYSEINDKIKSGKAVVLTASEFKELAKTHKTNELVQKVDVVTTATFGPMCSSGAFLNFGHSNPAMRLEKLTLNDVPAYGGLAAVDAFIGATETANPQDKYGGAHVIEDLIAGKDVRVKATSKGTDCYPRKEIETNVNINDLNEAFLFNPRNAYQNYASAVNSLRKKLYTYMGVLLPNYGNINYSTSGEYSPLLNDPEMRTIGIGTRLFLGGAQGFVAWNGTQFNTSRPINAYGIPLLPAATLSLIGNMKEMSTNFIKAAYYEKYGTTLFVGVGVPIPVLDEDLAGRLSIRNKQIETHVLDYALDERPMLGKVNYEQLQSGFIELKGKKIRTASLSSIKSAIKIMDLLKQEISNGKFYLAEPVQSFPKETIIKPLKIR